MLIPLFDYEKHRIIMESPFKFKGKDYLYFPDGCNFYSLYRTTRKINSFSELEYVAEKFIYLNPGFNQHIMKRLFVQLSDRQSGHIIRTYGEMRVEAMVEKVCLAKKTPYCSKLRKIIFNPSKMIDKKTKMQIVGRLVNTKEKPPKTQIDGCIEELWLDQEKITIGKIADRLNKSRYLIKWYFDNDTVEYIKKINQEIKDTLLMSKAIEAIDILTDNGNRLKMRRLKEITSIRDYALLKKAVSRYQSQI